jgi:hypothetical protein
MANKLTGVVRYWFFKRASSKNKRIKKIMGYSQAKSFGIIYDASTEENYRRITRLVKDLQQDQKKVKTLGYINLKTMPEYSYPKLIFEFCNSKDFSFSQHPKTNNLKDFAAADFDILIDLTPSSFDHMKYVCAISDSRMKVGKYHEKYIDVYDLLLQLEDNSTQEETIEHMLHYIKMINNDKTE